MTPDQIEQIGGLVQFDRKQFEQQGSGLGLEIARRLTQLQGGHFQIESQLGLGTTVTMRFNLMENPPAN
jgi:signal transduction histidine kinase